MEQENQDNIFNKKVGNIEKEKNTLSAKIVTIVGYTEQTEKSNGDKMKVPLVQILIKHPDKEETIKISKIKVLLKDKVITKSLWVQLDADNNIQKSSAIDNLLSYHKVNTISELEGKIMDTVMDEESNFLCLKAY